MRAMGVESAYAVTDLVGIDAAMGEPTQPRRARRACRAYVVASVED